MHSQPEFQRTLVILNADDIEIDLHLFIHDRGSGFHHSPYDELLFAQEQEGHNVHYMCHLLPWIFESSWWTHTRMGDRLIHLMRLVLILGLAMGWKCILFDLPSICSNTLDSTCSLIILIMVCCTGVLTLPAAGAQEFLQFIMWPKTLIFLGFHFILSKCQSYLFPADNDLWRIP